MRSIKKRRIEVSNHAASRLGVAAAWLDSYAGDHEILVVGPTADAADDLYLRTVGSKGSSFGTKRLTLNGLATQIARAVLAESGCASASALSVVAVTARAIHALHADKQLAYFAPVATRPGFPIAVARTLEELRMNKVEVQAIARLARGGSDLATIAQAVEHELETSKL